ncbi:putative fungal specific transcription protein [Fonsecaea pedrosoi]|nr:putative fungal specific transcription protein [Fonsecaea pedrosoi]
MDDPESIHFESTSHPNDPSCSFDSLGFPDVLFDDGDLWPLSEGFFDPAGDLSGLDTLPQIGAPESLEENDDLIQDLFIFPTENPPPIGEYRGTNSNEGADAVTDSPHDLESILPNHYVTLAGFGYWLSICSGPGIAWICQKHRSDEFAEIAEEMKASWARQLKLEHTQPMSQSAEPEPSLAWLYCEAYFERSVDNLWESVYRLEFEQHLRSHLAGKGQGDDPAWYALRNVVYAGGCRMYRSQFPEANSSDVQRESWSYFSNSLSVHSELLLTRPTMLSVRALLTMALFAEGLASPALSSGLASNAALLAQSLGLHRKRVDADAAEHSEALQSTWLFWAVYCTEKHIAQRCGQPSLIDDDDISCDIPETVHPGSTIEPETLTYIIQTCRFYHQISKQMLTTRALEEPPERMLSLVEQFDNQLQAWKESIPLHLRPTDFLKQFKMPGNRKLLGLMTAHCSFYDLVMAAHSTFLYPWVIESFSEYGDTELAQRIQKQIHVSSHLVANAARSLIVVVRSLDMDSVGTQSFALHFPMRAFVNLFVFVLQNLRSPSVQSDLALLDVAAGFFGQMEFITGSKISFPFARDVAALARSVVAEAQRTSSEVSGQMNRNVQMSI